MIGVGDELLQDYLAECNDHLSTVEMDLLALERSAPSVDDEVLNRLFRAVHSVKGGAGLFDLAKIRELAHEMESVLALMRSHKLAPQPQTIETLLRATDALTALLENPGGSAPDITSLVQRLSGARASAGMGEERPARLRMLLVEDDFASRLLLQTFLCRYGECHIAVNGKEAVEAFRMALDANDPYSLICMDIMMPEMDGREATRRIRAMEEARGIFSTAGATIIMTTTVEDIREVIRCFRELCDAYLMKPIDLGQLVAHMKTFALIQ